MNEDLIYFKENLDFSDRVVVKQYILALEAEIMVSESRINDLLMQIQSEIE
jgi:hypothetical protein